MKVLTLNTWQERGPWKERWEITFQAIEKWQPEIITFQEVFNAQWVRQIGARIQYPSLVFEDNDSGLMIASKYVLQESGAVRLRTQSPQESYGRYGLFAKLNVEDQALAVFTTHLSWKLDDGKVREAQVAELVAWIQEKAAGVETIITGDFNATPSSDEVQVMIAESGFMDTFAHLQPGLPGLTWDNRNPYAQGANHPLPDRRIDYIFTGNGKVLLGQPKQSEVILDKPNAQGVFASDHFGVLTTFEGGDLL